MKRNQERDKEIKALSKKGLTFIEIAKKYSISPQRVRQVVLGLDYYYKDVYKSEWNHAGRPVGKKGD